MILPAAVEEKIFLDERLFLETERFQNRSRFIVFGHVAAFDAVEIEVVEREFDRCANGLGHEAFALVILVESVSDDADLDPAATDIVEAALANDLLWVIARKQVKTITAIRSGQFSLIFRTARQGFSGGVKRGGWKPGSEVIDVSPMKVDQAVHVVLAGQPHGHTGRVNRGYAVVPHEGFVIKGKRGHEPSKPEIRDR